MSYPVLPHLIVQAIKNEIPQAQIVDYIQNYLDEAYILFPDEKPTVAEFVREILPDIRRVAAPDPAKVLEAIVLSKSSDATIKAKYQDKLLQYLNRYELIEAKFGDLE